MIIASSVVPTLYIALMLEPLLITCSMVWPATARSAPTVGFVSTPSPYRTRRWLLTRTIPNNGIAQRASPTSLKSKAMDCVDDVRLSSPICLGERLRSLDLPNGENRITAVPQRDDVCPGVSDSHAILVNESGEPLFQAATLVALTLAFAALVAPPDAIAASTASAELVAQASASAASVDVAAIFAKAGKASVGGGASGAAAAVVQVLSLMWLRTTMNFQVWTYFALRRVRNGGIFPHHHPPCKARN